MKNMIFILSFILISLSVNGCKVKEPYLRTNGVYQSKIKTDGYWYYFRFYKDSLLISVTSEGKPKHLKKWFNQDKEFISKGKYKIKNDSIFFYSTDKNGTVNYKGKILKNKISLYSESEINGYKREEVYKFQK